MRRAYLFVLAGLLALFVALPAAFAATVPPTIPHPPITTRHNNGFYILVKNLTTGQVFWQAPYLYSTPYQPNTGWLAGDRVAYSCAYAFFQHDGEIVGRVTFQRIVAASTYTYIIDKFMTESSRWYDGSTIANPEEQQSDCPPVGQDYTSTTVPDERPKVVYWSEGFTNAPPLALEIRDYLTTQASAGVTFDLVEVIDEPFTVTAPTSGPLSVNSRVTVLARLAGVPFAVVYYDGIGTGHVTEEACAGGCPTVPTSTTMATTTTAGGTN